ncbi:MAG TPA: hypothetical protein VJ917_02940 [Saprospiraceae bacterium]|nr:hypothetical protein [Saprospiraceae bacterium]
MSPSGFHGVKAQPARRALYPVECPLDRVAILLESTGENEMERGRLGDEESGRDGDWQNCFLAL